MRFVDFGAVKVPDLTEVVGKLVVPGHQIKALIIAVEKRAHHHQPTSQR